MNVLALTRYDRLGASSRVRLYQYIDALNDLGIQIVPCPLLSNDYVATLQDGKKNILSILGSYIRRAALLIKKTNCDLVWIEKEMLPWLPAGIEHFLLRNKTPFVIDYDDAVFHLYGMHSNLLIRSVLRNKHASLMKRSALVISGNPYIQKYAAECNARNIALIPSAVDLLKYSSRRSPSPQSTKPTVGWIGQRSTAQNLQPLKNTLIKLASERAAHFSAIGIDASLLGLPMQSVAWSEDTEVGSIMQLDLGIMPLIDAPFERGKCGYKLIQYMAAGLPVIASPVGVNRDIVEHGVNGYLADSPDEWEHALRELITHPQLRAKMGAAGRRKVELRYSVSATAPLLEEALRGALKSQAR